MAKKEKPNLFERIFRRSVSKESDVANPVETVEAWEGTIIDDNSLKTLRSLMCEVYPEFKDKYDKSTHDETELSVFGEYCSDAGLLYNKSFDKLRAFMSENGIYHFSKEFEYAFIDISQDFLREQAAQKEYEKEFKPVVVPAKNLPNGWEWVMYDDGSGSLNSPSGESYFSYDRQTYSSAGWIEYQKSDETGYSIFYDNFDAFVEYAEDIIAKERGFLGRFDVSGIAGTMERNAWNCIAPTTVRLVAGDNNITIEGYGYEPSYEYFSATSSVSLNGEVLYGVDSRNVAPYRNEVYQVGKFDNIEDAIVYIREQIDGLEICLDEASKVQEEKSGVDDLLLGASAEAEKKNVSSEIEKSDNAAAFEK